jgi:hypothetical protein
MGNSINDKFNLKSNDMKATTKNQKMNLSKKVFALVTSLMLLSTVTFAQEQDSAKTLFKSNVRVSELWSPEVKINSIQNDIGTLIGFYGGALIDRSFLLGIAGGVNVGHPRINYGYFGGIGQYIYKPDALVHGSGQLLVAYGSTKDYENPKSGLFDNFWNISGAHFLILEPGINIELNLSNRLTLVTGISYRWVSGLNESDEDIQITHVTNNDLSGINFNIGLKIMKIKKPKVR